MPSEVFCPKCGRPMVERTAKKNGRKFWGCPAFFPLSARNPNGYDTAADEKQCDGVSWAKPKQAEIVKVAPPKIKGSPQQLAIWQEMEFGTEHLLIKALAGTGKTTTIVIGAEKLSGSTIALAFNNKIARELTARMPERVQTSTFHSYGWNVIRQVYGKGVGSPNKWKSVNLIAKYIPEGTEDNEANNIKFSGAKLVALCKNRLVNPTPDNLQELCERYRIEVNGEADRIFEIVPKVLKESADSKTDFDFDDMIWIPIVKRMPLPTFSNVLVDECQDLNPARIEMAFRAAGNNGRIIAVGDENQAIYGFTGSDEQAMRTFEERLSA